MDGIREWRKNAYHRGNRVNAAYSSNQEFVVSCADNVVTVFRVGSEDESCLWSIPIHSYGRPILSLSQARSARLSISIGARTTVYDISSRSTQATLFSNERAITSAAWSSHDGDVLATGHIDGRVCLWDVKQVSRPIFTFHTGLRPCHQVSWCKDRPQIVALSSGQCWQIWQIGPRSRALSIKSDLGAKIRLIQWHPFMTTKLFSLDSDGDLIIWEACDILELAVAEQGDEDEDHLFGEPDDVYQERLPYRVLSIDNKVTHAAWFGTHKLLLLAEQGRRAELYRLPHTATTSYASIWHDDLEFSMDHFELAFENGETVVSLFGNAARLSSVIPRQDLECFDVETESRLSNLGILPNSVDSTQNDGHPASKYGFMRPETISALRMERANFSKTSRQLQRRRRSSHPSPTSRATTGGFRESPATAIPATPQSKAMTSSLELPKLEADESPMPFLSPTIPSRKPSPSTISPLDKDLQLPSISHETFEPLATTSANDSDSDDETFDGHGMHGSGNLNLPGGVNVPLPKSCGALFAPNGQLVTYFPPQLRLRAAKANVLSSEQGRGLSTRALGLFSAFGNLHNGPRQTQDSSDSESLDSWDEVAISDVPGIDLQPPSFPGKETQPNKLASAKSTIHRSPSQQTITVSVRNIDATSLGNQSRAIKYRVLCFADETGAQLCTANAKISEVNDLDDDAEMWRLLGRLFSNDTFGLNLGHGQHRLAQVQKSAHLVRSDSGVEIRPTSGKSEYQNDTTLVNHTMERGWVIDELFAWAEKKADVQMLACMSAVLTSAAWVYPQRDHRAELSFASKLATHDPTRPPMQRSPTKSHTQARPVPVLRNDSRDFFHQSPAKLQQTSHTSSRNPSQPTTPYLESLSSTPPFPFPNLSRQGSRLSTSGSASPEHHRSSFSAAAKYYAQSITDKFSSYGTSPPSKRLGISPGNELPSSLPMGSWSKSVSFASTVDTTRDSNPSRGLPSNDDDYDSDRTVEDTSLPHTPKQSTGPLFMKMKVSNSFADSARGGVNASLMPLALVAKAQIWMGYYAEQLRCWDMLIEAAEIEKIAGINLDKPSVAKHRGMFPVPVVGKRRATCSVCFCKIESIEHVCAHCLHTTHLSCLQIFVDTCGPDDFECPTGCGCACSLVPYTDTVWEEPALQSQPTAAERRESATDPRVWRARIQSDSFQGPGQ